MEKDLFQTLVKSIKQAGAIERGEAQASRRFDYGGADAPAKPTSKAGAVKVEATAKITRLVASPKTVDVMKVRKKTGLSQTDFAVLMNVSVRTLQNWEQHRRAPTGPAASLLRLVNQAPETVLPLLHKA